MGCLFNRFILKMFAISIIILSNTIVYVDSYANSNEDVYIDPYGMDLYIDTSAPLDEESFSNSNDDPSVYSDTYLYADPNTTPDIPNGTPDTNRKASGTNPNAAPDFVLNDTPVNPNTESDTPYTKFKHDPYANPNVSRNTDRDDSYNVTHDAYMRSASEETKMGVYIAPKFLYTYEWLLSPGGVMYGSTFGGAIAVGYNFGESEDTKPMRMELEYSISSPLSITEPFLGGETIYKNQTQTFFLNSFIDFHNSSNFTPYIGSGIGIVINTMSIGIDLGGIELTISDTSFSFIWNVGVGLAYEIDESLTLDLNCRYASLANSVMSKGHEIFRPYDLHSIQALLGVRYTF